MHVSGAGSRLAALAKVAITAIAGTLAADGTELGYDTYRIDTGEADSRFLFAGRLTGGTTEDQSSSRSRDRQRA